MTSATQPSVKQISRLERDFQYIGTRRFIWLFCFGLSSLGLALFGPDLGRLAILMASLSTGCWIWSGSTTHLDCNDNVFGTILGSMLNAILLAMAIGCGNHLANQFMFEMQGLVTAFATFFGLLLFAAFTMIEASLSFALQVLTSQRSTCESWIAYQLDLRFGGFLGEISR